MGDAQQAVNFHVILLSPPIILWGGQSRGVGEDEPCKIAGQALNVIFSTACLAKNKQCQKSDLAKQGQRRLRWLPVSPVCHLCSYAEGQEDHWKCSRLGKHLTGASRKNDFQVTLFAQSQ